ncbi:MAG: DNA internalization-related competence protein ComEC/Rec2 [Desulfamplus sp.]|nr:DNA internalization-related competence protein ComEC/Rec2 [Desulfamplus sp.]
MKLLLKYGIPPLIPLFIIICIAILFAKYLPIFNGKPFFDYFPRLPENHISKFVETEVVDVVGVVASKPEEFDKRLRFDFLVEKLIEIESGSKINKFPFNNYLGMIQVNVYNFATQYRQGETISFRGKIKSLRNFNNPKGFDYVRYMQNRDLWGRVNIDGKKINTIKAIKNIKHSSSYSLQKDNIHNFLSYHNFNLHNLSYYKLIIDNFRESFTTHILRNSDNKDSSAILSALTIGNKDLISKELQQDFSRTGASHILAISGLHLSIVATLFFYLLNISLSFSKVLLIHGWSKKGAAIITLFPLMAYGVISGFSDATQRAMVMVIIFMSAKVIERESDNFNSLAFAGIVILIFDPLSLFTISFQLSFAAVFFILIGLSLINQYQPRQFENLFLKKFISFVLISIFATAGTQILVMHYFNIFSFSGLITNLVLIPVVGFVALPIGLASLFFYLFSVSLSGLFIKCATFILTPCIVFIKNIANLPCSYIETFTPDILEISCYYILTISLFFIAKFWKIYRKNLFKHKIEDNIDSDTSNFKLILFRCGVVAALSSLLIISIYESVWIYKKFFNKDLLVTIIDVGQGNSALIEMPKGKTILVDGGGFSYIGNFDTGENIIAPFLRHKKIKTLDVVILTHPDSDHLNGLIYILNHFNVKTFIKNCDERDNIAYKNLMEAIQKNSSRLFVVDKIEPITIKIGEGELKFFHPLKPCKNIVKNFLNKEDSEILNSSTIAIKELNKHGLNTKKLEDEDKNINDNSLVFKVIFKDNSILFTGDITADTETEIIDKYKYKIDYSDINRHLKSSDLKSDILIAPHHGSSGSSSDFFLDIVAPENIVISCGWQNRFGFPKNIVLNRYKKRGIKVFRTDLNGAVMLYSDGTKWEISSFL